MVVVAGIGNPLLDLTVNVNDNILLKKYNLNEDDQIEFEEGQMRSLLHDINKQIFSYNKPTKYKKILFRYQIAYTPGGCAQNTLRIFQWLSNSPNSTLMFGAIGDDKQGKYLKTLVEAAGVQTRYVVNSDKQTGMSVALIKDANRSLIAYIGAAETMNLENFNLITNSGNVFDEIDLLYMEGFFIPERKHIAKHILNCCVDKNKLFAFNISAPYICEYDPETMKYFVENCDIMFGNEREYEALAKSLCINTSIKEMILKLCKTNVKENWIYKKIAVVTNGSKSVMCVHSESTIEEIHVPKINATDIKDTTGAGDSFAAGFLFGIFNNRKPIDCLKFGCWTAQQIIRQVGCNVPDYPCTILNI